MSGEPILVVDDNAENLKLASFILESRGYDVRTARDANEAFAVLRSFHPRMILMDLQLPGMDGLAVTRQLKGDPLMREVIIIAVTAYAMKGDEQKALGAGCDGYLAKPIDKAVLLETVKRYLRAGSARPSP
jgi:two-component system, cell cycle response regulator DivK